MEKPDGGCWLWKGCVQNGYGIFRLERKNIYAHRMSLALAEREIPEGLVTDHLCRVKNCVNPEHLDIVTAKENTLRGVANSAINARKTHCIRGHDLSVHFIPSALPRRRCKTCRNEKRRKK